MKLLRVVRQLATVLGLGVLASCAGPQGCACVVPIPGGFPAAERTPNAVQLRLSSTGIAAIEDNAATLLETLASGGLRFDIPAACGAGDNPKICCDDAGNPLPTCGPIAIDVQRRPGDSARLELDPVTGAAQLGLRIRARIKTEEPLRVRALGTTCTVTIDTEDDGRDSLSVAATLGFAQSQARGTTELRASAIDIDDLDGGDIDVSGGLLCGLADLTVGLWKGLLIGTFEDRLAQSINQQVCKPCPGGTAAECGELADACTAGICMSGQECMQELGVTGRLIAGSLFATLSPTTLGALDVYEVAGGYVESDSGGLSVGFLGGMQPGGAERDRCGPPAEPPPRASIARSAFFTGNTRPDTGAAFDVAIGIHQQHLTEAAWAAYEGGFLCLNVDTQALSLLNSDSLALLMPSLLSLLHGEIAPMRLGLRPQQPPTVALGAGSFTEVDGQRVVDEPLLDISWPDLELDFYAMVDDQWIRVMTVRTDVRLPMNLDIGASGELIPVMGELEDAFSALTVTHSEALEESPAELEATFPALLAVALPLVADGLGGFVLPQLGGLEMRIPPDGIAAVDGASFLALFGSFGPPMAAARVATTARIVGVVVPPTSAFSSSSAEAEERPRGHGLAWRQLTRRSQRPARVERSRRWRRVVAL